MLLDLGIGKEVEAAETIGQIYYDEKEQGILLFADAIEATDNLSIEGTDVTDGSEIIIINDSSQDHTQITIPVSEIITKVKNTKDAKNVVSVINNERSCITLHGITRIVGYFSKTSNWNRSKIGELKDRQKGAYSVCSGDSFCA